MNIFSAKASDVSIPLYVGGLVVLLAGILAVAYQMADSTFTTFTVALPILGVTTSYLLRSLGVPPRRWIRVGVPGAFLALFYTWRFGNIVPEEARVSTDMTLACGLALVATFYSFLLATDEWVAFTCVFTIALIGLTGSANVNRELIISFVVFLGAAIFLLVHQNYLQNKPRQAASSLASELRLVRTQLIMAFACGLTALLIGLVMTVPLQMVGQNLSLASVIRRLTIPAAAVAPGLVSATGTLNFDDFQRFEVGLGPVADDQTQVLTVELVEGGKPLYWRGRTYDAYTGSGWERTLRGPRREIYPHPEASAGNGVNVFFLPDEERPRRKLKRYVHRFRPRASGFVSLYAAAEPREVRAPFSSIIYRRDNTVGAPWGSLSNTAVGQYEVASDVSEPTESDLRNSRSGYPSEIIRMYQLQGINDQAYNRTVEELAEKVTAETTNPYDKAEAIRRFVAQTCTYTLDAPAIPRDRDVVEHFLTVTQQGYCDLYATAVAVLCRYAGLPARIATGFVPGTPSPDNPREYVLRNVDRHAWAEVYFAGYGWIPFDATSTTGTPEAAAQARARTPWFDWQQFWARGPLPAVLVVLGLLALLYVLKTEVWDRFASKRRRGDAQNLAGEVAGIYDGAVRGVARRGVARPATMTPGAYVEKVRAYLGNEVADALAVLTALAERALYGPQTVTPTAVEAARRASQAVRAALKRGGRRHVGRQAAAR